MVTLKLNDKPLPASLLSGILYELEIGAQSYDPASTTWSVMVGSDTVAHGSGNVQFIPDGNQAYTIFVVATNSEGRDEEAVFSFDSVANSDAAEVSVNWTSLTYSTGEVIEAYIRIYDPKGLPPSNLIWILFRNNVQVATGFSRSLRYQTSSPGVYRVAVVAVDAHNNVITGDSAIYVEGGFEIQASPQPPEVAPSCIYLGALYVNELVGAGGPVTSLPYFLACYSENVHLLPGTTHISFDLDPLQNTIDDEVVVRTQTGNYLIKGYPTGLWNENVGYDYTGGLPMLVAPLNGVLRLTVEALNVHGPVALPFNFRVRVKCWRQGPPVYQYVKCPYSTFPGGNGKRFRHFAALFTEIEAKTDADTDLNRLGSTDTNEYSTPEFTSIPLTTLATDGAPNPVQARTGLFFTASNWFSVYEAKNDLPELDGKAVAAQDGLRPFYFTLQEPDTPPIIQQIKRLKGSMAVYMSQGSILSGSTIRIRVLTGKITNGVAEAHYTLIVDQTVYNNSTDTFQRIGSLPIDISDFSFSINGVVVFFDVDESTATPPALPCDPPDPVVPEPYINTRLNAPGVLFDGACYTQPVLQPTVTGENATSASAITGCQETICGPVGIYCYTDVATGSVTANFRQPLYFPAPFVAYNTDPLNCFSSPVLVSEASGTAYEPTVSSASDALCGDGWVYGQCNGSAQVVTVYPANTVPHDVVRYGSACWSRVSSVPISGSEATIKRDSGWSFVSAGSVTPVADCFDATCSGTVTNGSSVVYFDTQTQQKFPVAFESLGTEVPFIGAASQILDSGLGNLPRGEKAVTFTKPSVHLFYCLERGQISIRTGLFDLSKSIVVSRGAQTLRFDIGVGSDSRFVDLEAGDSVFVDLGNKVGLLSDRTRNKRTVVTWFPVIVLPRLFHTTVLQVSGSGTLTRLGFAGMTNRSAYASFVPPADVEQDLPNPDNVVTVQGASGPEYTVVRTRATGDPVPPVPGQASWYAGQSLTGPLTFRFYTSREDQGSHGEMDVWFSGHNGQFPSFFKVDYFRTLFLNGTVVRTGSLVTDVSRNSLRVTDSGSGFRWPREYTAADGERIVVNLVAGTVFTRDKFFVASGTDSGISSEIVPASQVINLDTTWTTTQGDFWTTTDGNYWSL